MDEPPLQSPDLSSVDRPPPLGSWPRVYALVIGVFVGEIVFFGWLTWAVS